MAGLDPRYIPLFNLQQQFVDKISGLPLQSGVVYFWQDNNRNNLKPIYQLSGAPPNYSYTALPNPITLTNAGTASDDSTDDIVWYAFPYDANGDPDNYFIQVFAEPSVPPVPPVGTPILTREAVPGVTVSSNATTVAQNNSINEVVNSQFVDVLFDPALGMTIAYIAGTNDVPIAPGWSIRIVASGSGTVHISRTSVQGSLNYATNPPYYLTVTPAGANISSLMVYQRLDHNPNIFANEWVNAGILLAPTPNPQVSIYYAPQGVQENPALITAQNFSAVWTYFNHTNPLALLPGFNTETADTGYVEIQIVLNTGSATSFSSVQIVALNQFEANIAYKQTPVIQQQNDTFFFFEPELANKPIPSYLVGWDFPMNPAQLLGDTIASGAGYGANKSFYAWDQTIVFQSINNGVGISRNATSGGITLTADTATGQFALIQYLGPVEANEILNGRASVYVEGFTNLSNYSGNVSLWACTDADLPNVNTGTNNSIVATLDATGHPATTHGTWVEVPRSQLGNANFNITAINSSSMLNGWAFNGLTPQGSATYFAIVVGFEAVTHTETVTIAHIGLCAGDIATRPAAKTVSETQIDCEHYYEKSYISSALPGTAATTSNQLTATMNATYDSAGLNQAFLERAFGFQFRSLKRTPRTQGFSNLILYSPVTGTANAVQSVLAGGATTNIDKVITRWSAPVIGNKNVAFATTSQAATGGTVATINATTPVVTYINYHYVADARLGIVN